MKPRFIEPAIIRNLLENGVKVYSSVKGRVGTVERVDANGWVHMKSNKFERYVTQFDRGDSVEIVPKEGKPNEMVIRNVVYQAPQTNMFEPSETDRDREFREFDAANPKVYSHLVDMTRQMYDRGHKKIGMSMLYEVLRWRTMLATTDPQYKLNNNYQSRYARKIMAEFPEFDGIFETRELKS